MRGRPLVVEWTESPETLQAMYERERNGHRRARLQALWLLRSGASIGEAGRAVGVDYRTVQRWVSWYRQGGLDAVLLRTPGYAAPGRPSRLTESQIADLVGRSRNGQFRTVSEAVNWSAQTYGVTYTYTGMYALLGRRGADQTLHQASRNETVEE
ncbi:MAG: transposase [Chloroflexia bacterium]|nr:transposase [Chloroflexia bacterium]